MPEFFFFVFFSCASALSSGDWNVLQEREPPPSVMALPPGTVQASVLMSPGVLVLFPATQLSSASETS